VAELLAAVLLAACCLAPATCHRPADPDLLLAVSEEQGDADLLLAASEEQGQAQRPLNSTTRRPTMADPTDPDLAAIRAALDAMPPACRYHGTNLEGTSRYREECCDTGKPSLLRRRALEALERVERAAGADHA
jgi:hypothetical protein